MKVQLLVETRVWKGSVFGFVLIFSFVSIYNHWLYYGVVSECLLDLCRRLRLDSGFLDDCDSLVLIFLFFLILEQIKLLQEGNIVVNAEVPDDSFHSAETQSVVLLVGDSLFQLFWELSSLHVILD